MENLKKSAIFVLMIMLAIGVMGYILKIAADGTFGRIPQDLARNITKGYGSV